MRTHKYLFILTLFFFGIFSLIATINYFDHLYELDKYKNFLTQKIISQKKKLIEIRVNNIITLIKELETHNVFSEKLLRDIVDDMRFPNNNYVFIIKIIDLNKDKFGIMLANPNRKDLEGKILSASYKDIKGNEFRKEFIEKIKKYGKGFVEYYYTTLQGGIDKKISLFKRYKNYIIAAGFYMKNINSQVNSYIQPLKDILLKDTIKAIILLIFITLIILTIIYFIISRLEKELKQNIDMFNETNKLQINEIIGNIAHRFRQPLNVINAKIINIIFLLESNEIDKAKKMLLSIEKDILNLSEEINNFLSITKVTDIRNFSVKEAIEEVLNLVHKDVLKMDVKIKNNALWNFNKTAFKRFLFILFINILKNAKNIEILIGKNEMTINAKCKKAPDIKQLKFLQQFFESLHGKFSFEIDDNNLKIILKRCVND